MHDEILRIIPRRYHNAITDISNNDAEELFLSIGQPPILRKQGREYILHQCDDTTQEDLESIVSAACGGSIYAAEDTIRQGYITLPGGHRIGLCGEAALANGQVRSFRSLSAVCIRIATKRTSAAIAPRDSTLILGPPGSGKTTLLRDCVRTISDAASMRVSVVDERGEIAATVYGKAQFDVGRRTAVLTGVPKAEGIMMMLRSMNPQWIAVDEITKAEDCEALTQASYCGVHLLATAHAWCVEDLRLRPVYQKLTEMKIFKSIILLRPDHSYTIEEASI